MKEQKPVFIADTCIGGLSDVKSLWQAKFAADVVFLADYAVNPVGVKNDFAIADVVDIRLQSAGEYSDTLVRSRLEALYPRVLFLDPGAYCAGLLNRTSDSKDKRLSCGVTGDVIPVGSVIEFAKSYLGSDSIVSL